MREEWRIYEVRHTGYVYGGPNGNLLFEGFDGSNFKNKLRRNIYQFLWKNQVQKCLFNDGLLVRKGNILESNNQIIVLQIFKTSEQESSEQTNIFWTLEHNMKMDTKKHIRNLQCIQLKYIVWLKCVGIYAFLKILVTK